MLDADLSLALVPLRDCGVALPDFPPLPPVGQGTEPTCVSTPDRDVLLARFDALGAREAAATTPAALEEVSAAWLDESHAAWVPNTWYHGEELERGRAFGTAAKVWAAIQADRVLDRIRGARGATAVEVSDARERQAEVLRWRSFLLTSVSAMSADPGRPRATAATEQLDWIGTAWATASSPSDWALLALRLDALAAPRDVGPDLAAVFQDHARRLAREAAERATPRPADLRFELWTLWAGGAPDVSAGLVRLAEDVALPLRCRDPDVSARASLLLGGARDDGSALRALLLHRSLTIAAAGCPPTTGPWTPPPAAAEPAAPTARDRTFEARALLAAHGMDRVARAVAVARAAEQALRAAVDHTDAGLIQDDIRLLMWARAELDQRVVIEER